MILYAPHGHLQMGTAVQASAFGEYIAASLRQVAQSFVIPPRADIDFPQGFSCSDHRKKHGYDIHYLSDTFISTLWTLNALIIHHIDTMK